MSTIEVTNINDVSGNASLVTDNGGLKTDKLTGKTTAGSIAVTGEGNSTTTNLQQGLCKSWCSFSGDDHVLDDSLNVGSVTDLATGRHQPNFSNNMGNGDYSVTASAIGNSDSYSLCTSDTGANATDHFSFYVRHNGTNAADDTSKVQTTVHGDLA